MRDRYRDWQQSDRERDSNQMKIFNLIVAKHCKKNNAFIALSGRIK